MAKQAALSVGTMALDEFQGDPENPKDHDIGAIISSLQRFGLVAVPVVNTTTGRIVAGHGRVEALRQLEQQGHAPPKHVTKKAGLWHVPYLQVAFDTDQEARAYLLADNRLTELGGWDKEGLLAALTDLHNKEPELVLAAGFDGEYIDELAADLGVFDVDGVEPPSLDSGDRKELQQLTFTLHVDQLEVVQAAVEQAQQAGGLDTTLNTNKNGNAITAVCQWYMEAMAPDA